MLRILSKKESKKKQLEINPLVNNQTTLIDKLIFNPEKFSFVKALDIAYSVTKNVYLKSNISYSSKYSDISSVEGLKDNIAEIYVNIYSSAGLEGNLPETYLENYITYNRSTKKALSDFLDIFNDRLLYLRYSFMKKHDITCISTKIEKSVIGNIIFSLSGFEFKDNKKYKDLDNSLIPQQFKISCQNLFWRNTRSSDGLKTMLSSFFNIPIEIKQFSGSFIKADKKLQTTLGINKNKFNELGINSILGNKIWKTTKGIEIIIGPLSFDEYTSFLPKSSYLDQKISKLQKMKEIIKTYVPIEIDVKMHFYLDKCFVKETYLNGVNRLNKDSFIKGMHNSKSTYFTESL